MIRHYYQETRGNYLFIAIELCLASLADVIANPNQDQWKAIVLNLDGKKALAVKDVTSHCGPQGYQTAEQISAVARGLNEFLADGISDIEPLARTRLF